jgi:uncharacterized protein (TIGR02118 family)
LSRHFAAQYQSEETIMVKLTVLYGQPKDPAAFERYYLDTHTPIALKVKGLRRFEIAKVLGTADGSPSPHYRTADLYFEDAEHMQQCLGSAEGQAAAADIANFATGGVTMLIADVQDLPVR